MTETTGEISISPTHGTRRFRRNARFTLADGVLTAVDRHGQSSSVALDGSPLAPSRVAFRQDPVHNRQEMAIVDAEGYRTFAIADNGHWDSFERNDFTDAAGLQMVEFQPHDAAAVGPDTRLVLDSTWWKRTPVVGPVGFAAGMVSTAGLGPRWIGFPILVAAFLYAMAAWASGAFAKHRKGKAWEVEQAYAAGDKHAFDAYAKARRKRLGLPEPDEGQPEAGVT